MNVQSLTLYDFTDKELLFALEEAADAEGFADSKDIADLIGIDHPHPAQCVGSRLAWLKRFRVPLETKIEEGILLWALTPQAKAIMRPKKIPAATQRVLDSLSDEQRIGVTEVIARQAAAGAVPTTHLTRRAWNHSMGVWKDPDLNGGRKKKRRSKVRV